MSYQKTGCGLVAVKIVAMDKWSQLSCLAHLPRQNPGGKERENIRSKVTRRTYFRLKNKYPVLCSSLHNFLFQNVGKLKPLCGVLWSTVNPISTGEILFPNLMSYRLCPRVAQFSLWTVLKCRFQRCMGIWVPLNMGHTYIDKHIFLLNLTGKINT